VASFDALVDEAQRVPIEGWDFSWLEGRATEDRPTWHYAEQVAERARTASKMLDLQSGGGEMLAGLPLLPPLMVATEGYAPNVIVAASRLLPRGATEVATQADRQALPFASASFDLVTSRHPVETWWEEISRVLEPGGTYFSQQVGPESVRELSEFRELANLGRAPACRHLRHERERRAEPRARQRRGRNHDGQVDNLFDAHAARVGT